MKKLSLKKIKQQLQDIQADPAAQEIVLNNLQLYNNLVSDYNNGDQHQQYLMYQLSQQIFKMLTELKKQQLKAGSSKPDSNVSSFLKNLKNKKDVETR